MTTPNLLNMTPSTWLLGSDFPLLRHSHPQPLPTTVTGFGSGFPADSSALLYYNVLTRPYADSFHSFPGFNINATGHSVLDSALDSLSTALPNTKRQLTSASDLYQDVTNIHNAVLANQVATENFNGGSLPTTLVEGVPVFATVGAIHVVNRKGFADALLAGSIDEADTRSIVQHTIDTVGQSIPSDVQTLIGKKAVVVASGPREMVIAGLKLLLNDHDTFSAALLQKAYKGDPVLNARANGVVAKIHNAIQGGIDAYSS